MDATPATRPRRRRSMILLSLVLLAPQPAPADPDGTLVHRVEPGETIWTLARRYGSSVDRIVERNAVRDVRRVRAGSTLRIPVAAPRRPAPDPPPPVVDAAAFFVLLDRMQHAITAARFEEALARFDEAHALAARDAEGRLALGVAQLEVLAATAQLAYGRRDAALAHLVRALAANPGLALDPGATSPKLFSVYQAARILAQR